MKKVYSDNAKKIYEKLYLKRDKNDNFVESIGECHRRVSHFLADNEKEEKEFFELLQEKKFRPNTPAMANAGINPDHSLCACFVLGLHDSMESIIEMWSTVAKIYSGGGGAGIPITNLRPSGASISTGGQASGPLSYAKVIQSISDQVRSGGKNRRAANILSFWHKHTDIFELVKMKDGNNDFSAINISVLVDDDFMKYTKRDSLWSEIVTQAWKTGDPGLLFYDSINRDNPFPSLGDIICSNPCSEIVLPPWSACVLGHMNLNAYLDVNSAFLNFFSFYNDIDIAVRFLNRIINKSSYPNPKFKGTMQRIRPIGLGLMGFADLLYKKKITYNSKEAKHIFYTLTQNLTKYAYKSSIKLAKDEDIKVQCPPEDTQHFLNIQKRFGIKHPTLQIANSTVTCLAPTGSTAISADASYSFEPMFALVWSKKLTDSDEVLYFADGTFSKYCSDNGIDLTPEVKQKIADNNGSIRHLKEFDEKTQSIFVTAHDISWKDRLEMQAAGQKNITMSISSTVNLPNNASVKDVEGVYKTAYELGLKGITVYRDGCREDQPVNFGGKAKKNEVDIEIVENIVKKLMEEGHSSWSSEYEKEQYLADLIIGMIGKYCPQATLEETDSAPVMERPQELFGRTVKMRTGSGELYLTINEFNGVPFEVFATIGKGGRSMSAKAEAIGRLVSLCLRAGVSVREIVKQLDGIGGDYPIFQEGRLIKSIPDAIATVLRGYEDKKKEEVTIDTGEKWDDGDADPINDIKEMKEEIRNQTGLEDGDITNRIGFMRMGEICPECGQPTFSYSSGCRGGMCKNPACGFSNCG